MEMAGASGGWRRAEGGGWGGSPMLGALGAERSVGLGICDGGYHSPLSACRHRCGDRSRVGGPGIVDGFFSEPASSGIGGTFSWQVTGDLQVHVGSHTTVVEKKEQEDVEVMSTDSSSSSSSDSQ